MDLPALEFDVATEAKDHNRRKFWARIFFALAAVPLAWLSYWVVFALVAIPVDMLGGGRGAVLAVTWAFMIVLAIEGFRSGRQLFDAERYARSLFGGLSSTEAGLNVSRAALHYHGIPNPFSLGFMVSQFLLCAPRSAVEALKAHRAIIRANEIDLDCAQVLFDELLAERDWVDVEEYLDHPEELMILRKLDVLWTRVEDRRAEMRISASLTHRLYAE